MGERFFIRPNARYTSEQQIVVAWPEGTTGVHAEGYLTTHADNLNGQLIINVEEGPTADGPWRQRAVFVYNGPAALPPPPRPAEMGSTVMRVERRDAFLRATMTPSQPMRFRAEGEWF